MYLQWKITTNIYSVLVLLLLLAVTATFARNLRCPANLNTNDVIGNKYDSTKYFLCNADGIFEEKQCDAGHEFDSQLLVGFFVDSQDISYEGY